MWYGIARRRRRSLLLRCCCVPPTAVSSYYPPIIMTQCRAGCARQEPSTGDECGARSRARPVPRAGPEGTPGPRFVHPRAAAEPPLARGVQLRATEAAFPPPFPRPHADRDPILHLRRCCGRRTPHFRDARHQPRQQRAVRARGGRSLRWAPHRSLHSRGLRAPPRSSTTSRLAVGTLPPGRWSAPCLGPRPADSNYGRFASRFPLFAGSGPSCHRASS